MARTGQFGGFSFDPDVFSAYMQEQPYFKNAIIASGILREDSTIMDLIGTKGNVGTMPFYVPLDVTTYPALNNDGLTDNAPKDITGSKQTFMCIQRMGAWTDKDFTRELTGAKPLDNVASQLVNYYQQVWQNEIMSVLKGVMGVTAMATHKKNVSVTTGTIADTNLIQPASVIELAQQSCGDMADKFNLVIMHSTVYARLQKIGMIEFNKYTVGNTIQSSVDLPTYNGRIVVVDDRGTVDTTVAGFPVYTTYLVGQGAILTADKTLEKPYYVEYDAETKAGTNKLYTKQSKVLHPNGFSFAADNVTGESPTGTELATAANWSLKFNHKNVYIAELKTNG